MPKIKKFWGENKQIVLFLTLIFVVLIFLIPNTTTPGKYDRRCWINWSNYIFGNGLANIYRLEVNYLPLYHYVLFVYGKFMGSTEAIIYNINGLKYITLFFELIGVGYVISLVKDKYNAIFAPLLLSLLIVLNPAFFYDNVLYGQVDGIYSSFLFISVFYAIKKKPGLSLLAFVIALNLKLQAITYAPLVFLINLPVIFEALNFRKVLAIILPSVVLQFLIVLPFVLNNDIGLVWNVVTGSQGRYPYVSMGAFNGWYFFLEAPKKMNDYYGVFGRSYNALGLVSYVSVMFLAIFPLLWWSFKVLIQRTKIPEFPIEKILILGIMMALIFFYFNTQMHARYIHSAMIFAGAYALYTKRYLIFGILSLGYFLNIESSAKILKGNIAEYEYFFFNPVFVSSLFLIVLILCFKQLYTGVPFSKPRLND